MGGKTSKKIGRIAPAVQSNMVPLVNNVHATRDELQTVFCEITKIAMNDLMNAAKKIKDVNHQDNLGELWKNIQRIKRQNIIADILTILTDPTMNEDGEDLDNIVQLLITYIDIIGILIRRKTLVLAASVIASEASRIGLCIAIVARAPTAATNC